MRALVLITLLAGCKFSRTLAPDGVVGPGSGGSDGPAIDAPPADAAPDAKPDAQPLPACAGMASYGTPRGSHTYRALVTPDTYDVQTEACLVDGAHLVTIDDTDENDFVHATLPNTWLGYDDLATEGTFTWQFASTSAYTSWNQPNEPNDSGGHEDCAYMLPEKAAWNDDSCGNKYVALCECEAPAPQVRLAGCMSSNTPGKIVDGRKYIAHTDANEATSWSAAESACESIQATLFVPADDHEDSIISAGGTDGLGLTQDIWIGLASVPAAPATFAWVNASPSPYRRWITAPGTPATPTCALEHETDNTNGTRDKWADVGCTEHHAFVCECDPAPP